MNESFIPHKTHKNTISTRARVIRPWVKIYIPQDFRVGNVHLYLRPLQLARDALTWKNQEQRGRKAYNCVIVFIMYSHFV